MKLSLACLATLASASAFVVPEVGRTTTIIKAEEETSAMAVPDVVSGRGELTVLADAANPLVKFWDPLNLAEADFYGGGEEYTIGFLRQSEIKHGRVAMAAFVGYCIQSNYHFPWKQTLAGDMHPSIDLSPEQQWDAVPANAKWQIFGVISALEVWDECGGGIMPHYTKGRQPGKYPSFQLFRDNIHFVLDLYDPFGFSKKMSAAQKEKRLVMEVNNGRLAMLGIFGFLVADKLPGAVPLLNGIAIPYDGDPMVPFQGQFSYFS